MQENGKNISFHQQEQEKIRIGEENGRCNN
jgi:hypothetical protein